MEPRQAGIHLVEPGPTVALRGAQPFAWRPGPLTRPWFAGEYRLRSLAQDHELSRCIAATTTVPQCRSQHHICELPMLVAWGGGDAAWSC
ncbi:hypothetical protein CEXT_432771 [Caerostris extrusa]|uniref:Uncharacterized protein n=1 Tax=Caerostris extrusa TaxID=172846 RepID=A0AAV4PKL0_CAEEX|nr:hypothetical protein CEXT_432771 [Caerostris extrusa]